VESPITGGTLTIIGSTIANNKTQNLGGGVASFGDLAIINSTVSGNRAEGTHDAGGVGDGGGINCGSNGVTTITNSTISNNFASESGGGVFGKGTITHSTFSGNQVQTSFGPDGGGGIYVTGDLTISHTILRTGVGANISNSSGAVYSRGYNISNDGGGGFLTGPGDQINTDPVLGPLANNGGPTLSHALLNGSPAIDAGDPGFTPPPYEDQRGYPRVFNGRLDIGSLEV
jgi:predicted outer membrane repeat protein